MSNNFLLGLAAGIVAGLLISGNKTAAPAPPPVRYLPPKSGGTSSAPAIQMVRPTLPNYL